MNVVAQDLSPTQRANHIIRTWNAKSISLFLEIAKFAAEHENLITPSEVIASARKKQCSLFIGDLPRFSHLGVVQETETGVYRLTEVGRAIVGLLSR